MQSHTKTQHEPSTIADAGDRTATRVVVWNATRGDENTIAAFVAALATFEREPNAPELSPAQLRLDLFPEDGSEPCAHVLFAAVVSTNTDPNTKPKPTAFALFFPAYSTWKGRVLHLEDLFVEPESRGLGLGSALLTAVAADATRRGCVRLEWSALLWNQPAIDFYERRVGASRLSDWIGFRVAGRSQIETLANGSLLHNGPNVLLPN